MAAVKDIACNVRTSCELGQWRDGDGNGNGSGLANLLTRVF